MRARLNPAGASGGSAEYLSAIMVEQPRPAPPVNLLDLDPDQAEAALEAWVTAHGEPRYRVQQLLPRLWQRPVPDWSHASELPRQLVQSLSRDFPLLRPRLHTRQLSRDATEKRLWVFPPHTAVECVSIPEGKRRTLCISSQAGCAYACRFCATGTMGLERHLAPWEITAQVREPLLEPDGTLPTNVVFMGMGEPLHNWSAVDRALTILNHPRGFGIGARRVTVSTIGIIPRLRELAARSEQFRVALSLHSPFGEQRALLMPIERKYPLQDVLEVLRAFPRRVTFEYVMIRGFNDRAEDARELARIATSLGAFINLLPLHPGGAPDLVPTPTEGIQYFARELRAGGANVTVRRSRGLDISAACGQLRIETPEPGGVRS